MDRESTKVLLLDGGLSNELNDRVNFDVHSEPLWTAKAILSDPDAVIATHMAYLEAGADIIETASYQATLEGFHDFLGLSSDESQKLIRDSVVLAKTAVKKYISAQKSGDVEDMRAPLVAGSVGPYGVYLRDGSEYTGSYMSTVSKSQLEAMHRPRLVALAEAGADIIALETMPALEEVEIILNLLKSISPTLQAWVSFSVKEGKPLETVLGESMQTVYEKLTNYPQVVAFGINCCMPKDVELFLKEVKGFQGSMKLIVYPNSGQQWIRGQGWIKDPVPTADTFLKNWMQLGVEIVGGCCQIGPDQIRKMRTVVDEWNSSV